MSFPKHSHQSTRSSSSVDLGGESSKGLLEELRLDDQENTDSQRKKVNFHRNSLRLSLLVNFILILCLAGAIWILKGGRPNNTGVPAYAEACVSAPTPPWSPVREEGVLEYVNKPFIKPPKYQDIGSAEADERWEQLLGATEGLIVLENSDVPDTIHRSGPFNGTTSIYGIAAYHQLHCLNHIRKSFFREHYLPELNDHDYVHHRDHCIEVLIQTIQCSGDIGLTYWWHDGWSAFNEKGEEEYTPQFYEAVEYASEGKLYRSHPIWQTERQCINWERLHEWTENHRMPASVDNTTLLMDNKIGD